MARIMSKDPYKTFRFNVYWADQSGNFGKKPVAYVSNVSAITQTTEVIEYRNADEALANKLTPGQTNPGTVTLGRGITNDKTFDDWAQKIDTVNDKYDENLRKDIKIVLCDEMGNEKVSFTLANCWVSEYQAMPDLDAGDNSIAIESLTLENEGWSYGAWPSKAGSV